MGVPFPENICLLALFSATWFHRIAARLDRSAPDLEAAPGPGTVPARP
jgi:hypothetical protein